MKKVGRGLVVALWIAGVFVFDYFGDFPDWTYLPGIWECPGETNWFQFCR